MLSRECCGQQQGPYIRPILPSQYEDDILQAVYEELPMRHSGGLAAFVQAEQLHDAYMFVKILHHDNAHILPPHLSVPVEKYEVRYVRIVMRVLPVSIPRPIELDPPYVSSHISLRGRALQHQASTSSDKVYAP